MARAYAGRGRQPLQRQGGLTSGIDLALHVVGRYWSEKAALTTARYMEHTQTERPL